MSNPVAQVSEATYVSLYQGNIIPLRVVLAGVTWAIHDYFVTLESEIKYIWPQKRSLGKFMFLWVRYFTIALVIFDMLQIHTFSIPGVATNRVCVIIAPITRILGAIMLWSVEIIMQLRLYALYRRSQRVLYFNGFLFVVSIGIYLWILVVNTMRRGAMIAFASRLPLPGCPAINGGTEWALWIPPTVYEFILFLFVLYKAFTSLAARTKVNERVTLVSVLLQGNALYFFAICCLLIFNNLMVIGATKIPWFGFAPFHAAIGIVTCRTLIHLYKFNHDSLYSTTPGSKPEQSLQFAPMSAKTQLSSTTADLDSILQGPKTKKRSTSSFWSDTDSDRTTGMKNQIDPEAQPLPAIKEAE